MVDFKYTYRGLKFDELGFDYTFNNPDGVIGRHLKAKGRLIVAAAKRQVGVETGHLRQSIHFTHFRDSWGQYLWIGSNVNYAYMHHQGTRPHTIVPREAPILRFNSGTRIVYTRHVEHPGTQPNRFLSDQLYLVRI